MLLQTPHASCSYTEKGRATVCQSASLPLSTARARAHAQAHIRTSTFDTRAPQPLQNSQVRQNGGAMCEGKNPRLTRYGGHPCPCERARTRPRTRASDGRQDDSNKRGMAGSGRRLRLHEALDHEPSDCCRLKCAEPSHCTHTQQRTTTTQLAQSGSYRGPVVRAQAWRCALKWTCTQQRPRTRSNRAHDAWPSCH